MTPTPVRLDDRDVPFACATLRYTALRRWRMAKSTSFRIDDDVKALLDARAAAEGVSVTTMLERLIVEGVRQLDHPGIVYRGPAHDRRAGLVAGPDVWEVVARLQQLDGAEEERITTLAEESELHPRTIRVAVDYAATHPEEVRARIARNEEMAEANQRVVREREALIA